MTKTAPNIIEFVTDPQLLGLSLSAAQETLLRAIYGLPLTPDQLELWRQCTERQDYPREPFPEVTVIAGARAGKDSRIAAPIVVYEAVFGGHEKQLSKGERGMIPVVAQDKRATAIAFGYIKDYLERSPLLSGLVENVLSSEIELTNRITIACFPCTLRSLRGWSIPVAVMDELGFFRLEGQADSDAEIQTSVRRGMLAFPRTRLVKISTPYLKSGVLFDDFSSHWGQDSPDLLVWKASSALMNPTLRLERLERVRRLDPLRFSREYEAEFSDDLTAFLPFAWIEDAVVQGRRELPRCEGVKYFAAVDPSGGGADAFTLSIVHLESDSRVVEDVVRGWSRRSDQSVDLRGVVSAIATLLRSYGIRTVVGDRYAAEWVRQAFEAEGIEYQGSKVDKSAAYLEMLPMFSQGRLELLDHRQQTRELQCLERRTRAGGRDVVDHPRGGHDDHANALALSIPPDRAGLALDEWRDDLHVIDEFSVPPFWTFAAGLEFAYREGGIFVLFAVGPDGDMVGVEELTLHRTNAHRAGRLIAELCRQHVSEQLFIGSGERVWLKSGAPTLGEELMAGIYEVYDPTREFTPVIITSAEGPAADAARLAILHRYLEWTAGPDGTVPSWGRPRLKFTRKCQRTVQGLASLALDPGDRERVLENPAYDAVTAALMSRPVLPERPPEPRSQQQHPGLDRRGKRKKYEVAMQRELEGPPEFAGPKWHNPRPEDLEIVED